MKILGIDPGSIHTGYGLIESNGMEHKYIASGSIDMNSKNFALRLDKIFTELSKIITQYNPQASAIEQVFMHANAGSALKLGHARGAAITALAQQKLPIAEYSARQVKKAVVGYGAAQKGQVQHMVRFILKIQDVLAEDAADALAVALCHAQTMPKGVK